MSAKSAGFASERSAEERRLRLRRRRQLLLQLQLQEPLLFELLVLLLLLLLVLLLGLLLGLVWCHGRRHGLPLLLLLLLQAAELSLQVCDLFLQLQLQLCGLRLHASRIGDAATSGEGER
jgi:hypothetical protein